MVLRYSNAYPGGQRSCAISSIPVELIDKILKHTVVDADADLVSTSLNLGTLAPLRLSQVCAQWRVVATQIPALWTNIALLIDGTGDIEPRVGADGREKSKDKDGLKALLELYLENSRDALLDVTVLPLPEYRTLGPENEENEVPGTGGTVLPLLSCADYLILSEVLGVTSENWKSLYVDVLYVDALYYDGCDNLSLPKLERLILHGSQDWLYHEFKDFPVDWACDEEGPKLHEVEFRGMVRPFCFPNLPWNTIRLVTVGEGDLQDFVTMSGSTSISQITFRRLRRNFDDPEEREEQIAYFPSLTSIQFEGIVDNRYSDDSEDNDENMLGDLEVIFGQICVPALEDLVLTGSQDREALAWPHAEFLDMLERGRNGPASVSSLKSLTLKHLAITESDVIACLKKMPKLESLVWWDMNPNVPEISTLFLCSLVLGADMHALGIDRTEDTSLLLVPNLHTLDLRGISLVSLKRPFTGSVENLAVLLSLYRFKVLRQLNLGVWLKEVEGLVLRNLLFGTVVVEVTYM